MSPKPWYPTNGRDLLKARQEGLTPAGPVVVSLIGGEFGQPTLYVRPDMPADRIDWRMLVNVDVWLFADPSAALSWVLDTASRIAHARPRELVLRFVDGPTVHDVEIGGGFHLPPVMDLPAIHEFTWRPINCCGTLWGARLRKALIATHPSGTQL